MAPFYLQPTIHGIPRSLIFRQDAKAKALGLRTKSLSLTRRQELILSSMTGKGTFCCGTLGRWSEAGGLERAVLLANLSVNIMDSPHGRFTLEGERVGP